MPIAPVPMTSPPYAPEPFSVASRPISRAETLRRKLLALEPRCAGLDPDAGWDCPSASSSLSATPESSLPTTPSDEVPSNNFSAIAPVVSSTPGAASYDEPKNVIDSKKEGSIRRIIRKLESLSSLKLSSRKHGNRPDNVRDIFQMKSPSSAKSAPMSSVHVPDLEKVATCEPTEDFEFTTPILPGEYLHMRDPLDSMASLTAVHGSPTECDGLFTYFSGEVDAEGCPQAQYTSLNGVTLSALLRFLMKVIFFVPYTILVGLAPLAFPRYLSAITFSPTFGYVTRPMTPFKTFGHHARMLPYHVAVSSGVMALLSRWSPAFAIASVAITIGAIWWAWHDFSVQGEESGLELGADDRTSIYWIVNGVYLGGSDMVCTMQDLNRLCTEEDAGVDRYEATEEDTKEEEDTKGKDTEMFQEDNGAIDCIIRVPGNGAGESGTEMRIIVQCVD